jgi:hypothetical protein
MEISSNNTGMQAGLSVATDKDGRDLCVVVVKGTFDVAKDGTSALADVQNPLVTADLHHGDPGITSLKYECDFAAFKPAADVIVNASAFAPYGRPATHVTVCLEFAGLKKEIEVFGDRYWDYGISGPFSSPPAPFLEIPLLYERAFGGSDHSHEDPRNHGTELRNHVGVGFFRNPSLKRIIGLRLPNLENPGELITRWTDTPNPTCFGAVNRNWDPRRRWAGTYDDHWLNDRFPMLPEDFDNRHFQCAPIDQQVRVLAGGELVRCLNMTPDGDFRLTVPNIQVPVAYRFRDRNVCLAATADTLILEPQLKRCLMLWRSVVPLGRKINSLQEVLVGRHTSGILRSHLTGKTYLSSLAELMNSN